MNRKAEQWLRIATVFREREKRLQSHGGRSPFRERSIPPQIADPEILEFVRLRMEDAGHTSGCQQLHIEALYQGVLADPHAENELLELGGMYADPEKLEALHQHASLYKSKLEQAAATAMKEQSPTTGRTMRWLSVTALAVLLLLTSIGGWAYFQYRGMKLYLSQSAGTDSGKVVVNIPRGSQTQEIVKLLKEKGVLKDEERFFQLARYLHYWKRVLPELKAVGHVQMRSGRYKLSTGLNPVELLLVLRKGPKRESFRITIPEGFNVWKIAARLEAKKICRASDFIRTARDRVLGRQLLGWEAEKDVVFPFEGFLYPDTYRFARDTQPHKIIRKMVKRFKQVYHKDFATRARAKYGWNTAQVVTLASIIEKETGQPTERPRISTVFHNRRKRRWKMETDPTVIYGLLPKFNGNLTQRDLHNPHPYNTYKHRGLPPGPIASPGVAAIRAALYPKKGCDIFFVARGDRSHIFSCTKRQHECWVDVYQRKIKRTCTTNR